MIYDKNTYESLNHGSVNHLIMAVSKAQSMNVIVAQHRNLNLSFLRMTLEET